MGRSTKSSCFKIITCSGDSGEDDDIERPQQIKASTGKCGLSLRKRSARHRVLSNTVISELPFPGNKEGSETTTKDFHAETDVTVPEKISISQRPEDIPLVSSTAVSSKVPDTILPTWNADSIDSNLPESSAILVQAAIRGYLAQSALCKLRNVVKLQAAVRGHLVRRLAVGTLRCILAIIKMQELVRARRVRLSVEGFAIQEKLDGKHKANNQSGDLLGKENFGIEKNKAYSPTEKLLDNRFARQLLQSMLKRRPILINCDPSRSNLAWKWLERWMSLSASGTVQPHPHKSESNMDYLEEGKTKLTDAEVESEVQSEATHESIDLKSGIRETAVPVLLDHAENLITYNADGCDFQACYQIPFSDKSTSSSIEDGLEQPQLQDEGLVVEKETYTDFRKVPKETPDSLSDHIATQSNETSQVVLDSVSDKPEGNRDNPKHAMKRMASERLETEGKFVFGSRSNPAFSAVQSKFEELSSTSTSSSSISSGHDFPIESRLDGFQSQRDSLTNTKDFGLMENSTSNGHPRVQIGYSECRTEISISSTPDSPDRSEVEREEFANEIRDADKGSPDANGTTNIISSPGNLNTEEKSPSSILHPTLNSPFTITFQPGKFEKIKGDSSDTVAAVDSTLAEQQPMEQSGPDGQIQLETITDKKVYRSSPEGSPRSHISAPDSHGTPSSQISLSNKRSRSGNSIPKQRSQSVGKRSPSSQNYDSAARSTMEHPPKDPKSGKRRNSFGSVKPDHVDHEPRVSSSSNSLPNYMQATESARAKVHASNSPKSSPDVHEKDNNIKKRHSLPGGNGKQGSPRMQRSTSQAQHGTKGNTHSPQPAAERKWQR